MSRAIAVLSTLLCVSALVPATAAAQATINGQSAEAYFNGFLHKPSDATKADEWCIVPRGDATPVPGTKRQFEVSLFLFKGGKYVAVYQDFEPKGHSSGGVAHADQVQKFVQGTWSVRGLELHLSGLGVATAAGDRAIDLKLNTPPGAPQASGATIRLPLRNGSFGTYALRHQMGLAGVTPAF